MAPVTEATELYRNDAGKFAAITYAAGPKGHTVSLHGIPGDPFRVRLLDVETARLVWSVLRLKMKLMGFEKHQPNDMRVN